MGGGRLLMAKNSPRIRRRPPRIINDGDGVKIQCPYCHPPHPLSIEHRAPCGTVLELNAVQNLYSSVKCALCGGMQGTMVKIGKRYRHSYDCKPGHTIYTVPPKASKSAAFFWNLPDRLHRFVWLRLGKKVVKLSTEGKTTGYAWDKV